MDPKARSEKDILIITAEKRPAMTWSGPQLRGNEQPGIGSKYK
jgi:hypothetical protein